MSCAVGSGSGLRMKEIEVRATWFAFGGCCTKGSARRAVFPSPLTSAGLSADIVDFRERR